MHAFVRVYECMYVVVVDDVLLVFQKKLEGLWIHIRISLKTFF